MAKVKLLVGLTSGQAPGDELECSAAEAQRMINSGQAAPIATTVRKPVERAVRAAGELRTKIGRAAKRAVKGK